jgi:hypothetical protein
VGWVLAFEIFTIILYVIDLSFKLVSFKFVAEETSDESLFREQQKVSKKSMKIEIVIGFLSVIPFSLILAENNDYLVFLNFARLLRITKIWEFFSVFRYLKQFNLPVFTIIQLIFIYYIGAHIVACIFLNQAMTAADIRDTWLVKVPYPTIKGRLENNLDGLTPEVLYLYSIYFACNIISHITLGEIVHVSD